MAEDEFVVEQLLNLLWATLALGTSSALLLRQRRSLGSARAVDLKALIALLTALIVLFPVISMSDDLHPAMADVVDPAKRILQVSAYLHQPQHGPFTVFLAALLVFQILAALVPLQDFFFVATAVRALERERVPNDGRSPPRI